MYEFKFMTGREKRSGPNKGVLMDVKYWKTFKQAVRKALVNDVVVIQYGDVTYPLKAITIKAAVRMDKDKTLEIKIFEDIFRIQLKKLGVINEEYKHEWQDISD